MIFKYWQQAFALVSEVSLNQLQVPKVYCFWFSHNFFYVKGNKFDLFMSEMNN